MSVTRSLEPAPERAPREAADDEYLRRRLRDGLGIPFVGGNRIERLLNGVAIFPAMLEAIERAERTVELLTFIYWSGPVAERFAETLARRAREGLSVRVLLDGVGARKMPRKLWQHMEDAGVELRWFRPTTRWTIWRVHHRTHRKVLVCDGRVAFTGGVGIAEQWEGDARGPSEWRETHFRVTGPLVRGMRAAFIGNWMETGRPVADLLDDVVELEPTGAVDACVVRSVASVGWSDIATAYEALLTAARERIRITTAYFVPDEATIEMLCEAAERGVDVQILLPGPHIDFRVSRIAGQKAYGRLLRAGVRIHSYQRTMIHAKLVTLDGRLACLGSANFNQRSLRRDDELLVFAFDRKLAGALDADFDRDVEDAAEVDLESWRRRGLWPRIRETLVRLVDGHV
jgi:cardiolipin synthase